MNNLSGEDTGRAWFIRADGRTFLEDSVLCGADLQGGRTCIRALTGDLICPDHGQRDLPPPDVA